MNLYGFLFCLLPFTYLSTASAQVQDEGIPVRNDTDRIFIKYHPEPTEANALAYIKHGVTHGGFGVAAGRTKESVSLDGSVALNEVKILADRLEVDPQIDYAEPDYLMKTMQIPNDPFYNQQWHYFDATSGINLPAAWNITTGSSNVTVGVIDSGVLYHSDLQDKLLNGYDFIKDIWIANDGDSRDSDPRNPGNNVLSGDCGYQEGTAVPASPVPSIWHGTHVSGTIAAESNNGDGVSGISWQSRILPLRAIGRCYGYTSDIVDAMLWAAGLPVTGLTNNPQPVKVINMSLGGSGSNYCPQNYQNAINRVVAAGVTVVVAAGNESVNAATTSPANCNNVITVGAIDRNGSRPDYSNFGATVDISAPGSSVLSTYNSGQKSPGQSIYSFMDGTSMATPHVAGVVALMYAVSPNITPARVEAIIKANARAFPNSSCNTSICGAGILDAGAAVLDASDE
ncbi:peptidase [Endozoicomonas sp. OPT23]|uniref:S8 family peptidase n=1 Tax=Endozoicomonas sp. OPT23 TaxID=2072845 RepID=UPI00129B09C4|nr:S8 family peptidase [Endozoicomonas sp. OPT23]MRI31723.1 peptidase [Endozoicomonas sp. OPT23]